MAYELSQEVTAYLMAGGRGETPSERVVLYAIAERARVETRSAWEEPDWHLETIVGAGRLRDVLARLAARGVEVRVAIGVDSRGRKMYAYRGNQRTYRLPLLRPNGAAVPAPSDVSAAPFGSNGAAVPAPSDAVPAPSDAVPAPSDAVPAPYPYAVSRTPRPPVGAPPPPPPTNGSDGGGERAPHEDHNNPAVAIVDAWQRLPGAIRLGDDEAVRLAHQVGMALDQGVTGAQVRDALLPALPPLVHDVVALLSGRVAKLRPYAPPTTGDGRTTGRPTWCGQCDETTRILWHDDAASRCPNCHPLHQ